MQTMIFQVLDISKIPLKGINFDLKATDEDLQKLAERFDLPAVKSLAVVGMVTGGNILKVSAKVKTSLIQTCVVTLEPFKTHLDFEFNDFFSEDGIDCATEEDFDIDMEEASVELIKNGKLDLGEVIAQQFGINLDPFPKSTNQPFEYIEEIPEQKQNPFSVLKDLIKK